MTIAIGGILTECNHFVDGTIDVDWFERSELVRADELLHLKTGVVAGMVRALSSARERISPLLFASSCPGGPLTSDCYQSLKNELLERLSQANVDGLDGVLLPLHGAMAAVDIPDADGELIREVRAVVGARGSHRRDFGSSRQRHRDDGHQRRRLASVGDVSASRLFHDG